jgi:hypothetical protein
MTAYAYGEAAAVLAHYAPLGPYVTFASALSRVFSSAGCRFSIWHKAALCNRTASGVVTG